MAVCDCLVVVARKSFLKPLIVATDINGVRFRGHHFFMRPALGEPQSHANVVTETKAMRANHTLTTATDPVSRGLFGLLMVAAMVMTGSGCRLCCDSEDVAYPAYGGLWERTNRNSGRVGSLFDPGGARGGNMATKESTDKLEDALKRMAPLREGQNEDAGRGPSTDEATPKESEPETEEEFQERRRQLEKDNMLNTSVILGSPMPPSFR